MKTYHLDQMTRGWFVGDFTPSVIQTPDVEVGIKSYKAGEKEDAHYHKVAVELTAVVAGQIRMNGKLFSAGDVVVMEPGETCAFEAVTDAVNVVVKLPSVKNDKFLKP